MMNAVSESVLTGDQALTVEPFTELNVKLGAQWYVNESITVAAGTTEYLLMEFALGDEKRVSMKYFEIDAKDIITFSLYSGVDWEGSVSSPDQIDIKNFNSFTSLITGTTANFNPTQGAALTEQQRLYSRTTPDSSKHARVSGLVSQRGIEHIFHDEQKILWEFVNSGNSSVQIDFDCTWYEGRLSTDYKELTGEGF